MANFTIANTTDSDRMLIRMYAYAKSLVPHFTYDDLDIIFSIALESKELFPGIKMAGNCNSQDYILRWVGDYRGAIINPTSSRVANPKSSCSDPAVKQIVKMTQNISGEQADEQERYHNLFMSAENIQGNLLEEYIAISVRPYGWIWCAGNTLKAVDFCSSDGSVLLQIKNKSNTENSSSSSVREGTTIKKWYRLGTRVEGGNKLPNYRWELLNNIINSHKTMGYHLYPCSMSEEKYIQFITNIVIRNPNMITYE